MRCLVTGAAGFIGSHLARALDEAGHEVIGLDNLEQGFRENLAGAPGVELILGDVRDPEVVSRLTSRADVVYHLAAIRSVVRSLDEPALTEDVNVRGTLNVLVAARAAGARVVFASSSSVYGDPDAFPLREDMPPRPHSPYAASKLAGEAYCQAWWRAFGVPTVCLRYFNVYGPRMDPDNPYALVVPIFIQALLDGRRPTIHGDGSQSRDFTYVDDVVRGTIAAGMASRESFGSVFNIGGGRSPTSIRRLLDLIAAELGVDADPASAPPRQADMRRTEADIDRARSVLGYRPEVDIEEGIRRTVAWFVNERRPAHAGTGR